MTKRLVLSLLLLAGVPSPSRAQVDARAVFQQAQEDAEAERWADAERGFASAFELSGNPVALYNRAFALRALGRYTEAAEAFGRVAEEADLPEAARQSAREQASAALARTGWLVLQGLLPSDQLEMDGRAVDPSSSIVRADPGSHSIILRRPGFVTFTTHVVVRSGGPTALDVALEPESISTEPSSSVDVGWVAAGIVAGVLVSAGVVVLALFLDDEAQVRPASDLVFRFGS